MEIDRIGEGLRSIEQIFSDSFPITSFQKCKILNLHCNCLSSLKMLPTLHLLTELNLSSNLFTSCDDMQELAMCSSLTSLDLSANKLVYCIVLYYSIVLYSIV